MVLKNTGMYFLPLLILETWDKIIWNWTNSHYDMEIKLYNCSWVFKFAVDQAKYLGRRLKLDSALARLVNGKGSNFEGKGVARNSRGKSDILWVLQWELLWACTKGP